MTDYITLTCPSCGAKLEVTEDIGQFACAHCGREHILYQAGGIVALKPLVASMKNTKEAAEDVPADVVVNRLSTEIEELIGRKDKILTQNPLSPEKINRGLLTSGGIMIITFCSLFLFADDIYDNLMIGLVLSGIAYVASLCSFIFAIFKLYSQFQKTKSRVSSQIKELDEQIEATRAELQQLKRKE